MKMQLYTGFGPNPAVVRRVAALKSLEIPAMEVDTFAGDNRREPYVAINPLGTVPALVLDDGQVITEITAICEYFEEIQPAPSLLGTTPEQRAQTRKWVRRIDLNYVVPMVYSMRSGFGLEFFKNRVRCQPEIVPAMKLFAMDGLLELDRDLPTRGFVCGARFSLADIFLDEFLQCARSYGEPAGEELTNLQRWRAHLAQHLSPRDGP
jgi:glutathione S-transferase